MHRDVHDVLASYPVATTVHRELHDVAPHRVHEVTFDGQRAVCKIGVGTTARPAIEGRVLELVGTKSDVPVPAVLAIGPDHFVAAWCPGLPEDPIVDGARARAMGRGLARLHDAMADEFDRSGQLATEAGLVHAADERWSDTLQSYALARGESLADVGYATLAEDVLAAVETNRSLLDVDLPTTLLHGNYLPAHVAIDRSVDRSPPPVTCVVDFEHALVGAPGFDYVRTVLPTFGRRADGSALEFAFRQAYESVRPLPSGFERRRSLYEAINLVSYVEALHVQRCGRDSTHAIARDALQPCSHVRDRLASFRRQESEVEE